MLGSQMVVRALARRGVRTIFSLSGNQIMPLYDACIDARIRIVHVRHEASAVFMADAWAQVTGEVGVAMLTAGPGISNGIAPLYSALQAESPLLLLSGDSPLAEDGTGSFQELDQVNMTRPLTKLSRRVASIEELVPSVEEAMECAIAPRRGPVHLALPFDLLTAESGLEALPPELPQATHEEPAADRINAVAALLTRAQRAVVLMGPSASRSKERHEWRKLSKTLQIPCIAMESPRGLRDPSLGRVAEQIVLADVIVLAGKQVDFTLNFGRPGALGSQAQVVVIDPDENAIQRAKTLLGERMVLAFNEAPLPFIRRLASQMPARPAAEWTGAVEDAVRARPDTAASISGVHPRDLCNVVERFLVDSEDPILVCDGGEFGQWAQAFCNAPVRVINGMSGAIGGGICYAIAAKIARPNATVVALMGDGTSGFHFMEFDTATRENAPFIAVIGNDLRWNAEHVIQMRTYGADRLIGCTLAASARYHEVAKALGGFGGEANSADAVKPLLQAACESGLPACINVAIDGLPAPVFGRQASASAHNGC